MLALHQTKDAFVTRFSIFRLYGRKCYCRSRGPGFASQVRQNLKKNSIPLYWVFGFLCNVCKLSRCVCVWSLPGSLRLSSYESKWTSAPVFTHTRLHYIVVDIIVIIISSAYFANLSWDRSTCLKSQITGYWSIINLRQIVCKMVIRFMKNPWFRMKPFPYLQPF